MLASLVLCLAAFAQNPQAGVEQVQSLIDRGEFRPAIEAASRLITQSPRLSEAWRLRANARRNLNDLAGALEDANRAVDLDPANPRALGGRSIVKRLMKDAQGALADVTQAIALQPAYHQGYDSRALLRQEAGDLPGALEDASRALSLSPNTPNYLVRRAVVRRSMKEYEGAEADLSRAISLAPGNPHAYFQRGLLRIDQQRWNDAIADNSRAIELKLPNPGSAHNNRGLGYQNTGRPAEARRDFEEAIRIQPGDTRAAANLARLGPVPASTPPQTPPVAKQEGELEFLHKANFFRITGNGSVVIVSEAGVTSSVATPPGGVLRYGFPVQWSGDEFYYSGPSFPFDPARHPAGWTGGNINLSPGTHLVIGKVSPEGKRLLSLRLLTRGEDGHVFAMELRDIDLRNRQQKFDDSTLFLSNFSQSASYSKAAEMFRSTVRLLDLHSKWSGAGKANIVEYRPFGVSVSLFQDPEVPVTWRSKEDLAAVRRSLDAYWSTATSWARVIDLTEERLGAMFPKAGSR